MKILSLPILFFFSVVVFANDIPLKDFFRNPVSSGYQISPNGKFVSYLKPWEGRMNIHVQEVFKPETEKRITAVKDRDMSQYFWKENQIFYLKDEGGDENFHLFQVDIQTKVEKDITPFAKTRVQIVDELRHGSTTEILIAHNQRDAKLFDVYKFNIKTGQSRLILKNPGNYEDYGVDEKGVIRTVVRFIGTDTEVLYRNSNDEELKPVIKFDFTRSFQPAQFIPGSKSFYALSNIGRDKTSVVIFNPVSKKEEQIIYQSTAYDSEGGGFGPTIIYSHRQKKLLALNLLTWKLEQVFFDPNLENVFNEIKEKAGLLNSNLILLSEDKKENFMTVALQSDRQRAKFYLYDRQQKKIHLLAEAAPWLNEQDLAEMKPIQVVVRDGRLINGYLTLPKKFDGKPIPAVVNPHGGPWARDAWRFNSETQFLANRGFAVVQLNFRGSTGYGREHLISSYKQWGLTMQDDITDVTKWVIQQGIAHPKKVCIYGGSYGGYATLMGLVKEPDLYACGVDYVGVSNLFTFLKTIPPYWENYREKLGKMLGDPEKDKEQFIKTSPAMNVDKIKKPLFIAQGAKDPRVNKDESDQMVKLLKARGIDVPYLVKENEGHGFHNEENRFEFYGAMEEFLKKHTR